MEHWQREQYVARICSGSIRCRLTIDGRPTTILLRSPSREQLYIASEVYAESLREAELQGMFSDEELYDWMYEIDIWDDEKDSLYKKLPKEIDEFKVKLYKAVFKSNERAVVRKALQTAKDKLAEVAEQKNSYNYLSCSGYASICRQRYLIGCAMWRDGKQVFADDDDFWGQPSDILDQAMSFYSKNKIDEAQYRELARNEPWRSLWSSKKAEASLFGCAAVDYTEEQKNIVAWASLYDNIYQHPECPPDDVINDDDILDGWMIEQRRERDKRLNNKAGDDLLSNEKIRGSQEVFLVADTVDDARKIIDLNDEHAKSIQRKRFAVLKERGVVSEMDMPDTRQRLRVEATTKFAQQMKSGGGPG